MSGPDEPVDRDAIRQEVREEIAGQLERVAAGRREYARGAHDGAAREDLLDEANALECSARIARGDRGVILGLIPSWMWTEDEDEEVVPRS